MEDSRVKRAVVFAHFDRDDMVDDHVVYYLRSLRSVCARLVFVTTCNLSEGETAKLDGICDRVVLRENVGYDFMSYKVGLKHLETAEFDEIVLCNDSVYGPLRPLDELFGAMDAEDCDFWGITECSSPAYHVQSYFMAFRRGLIGSACFREFWEDVGIKKTKLEIIEAYEVGLSQRFIGNGFRARAYITFVPSTGEFLFMRRISIKKVFNLKAWGRLIKDLLGASNRQRLNATHIYWRPLISEKKMPFMKVELLRDNPEKVNVRDYESVITEHTDYPIELLRRHLARTGASRRHKRREGPRKTHETGARKV